MKKTAIILSLAFAFLLGTFVYRQPIIAYAGALYRDQFNVITISTIDSITSSGLVIIPSSTYTPGAAHYFSIVNSGTNGVSCFPITTLSTESTSSYTYGGGWWLAPTGGAISQDGVSIYAGTVWCVTGVNSTTIGVVAR